MKEIKEKQLPNEVQFLVWNDKIDILAVIDVNSEISLYRLSWKKIWSCYHTKRNELMVRSLIWKPDGKAVIVSYTNGEVILIGLDKKKAITLIRENDNEIFSYLAWFEKNDFDSDNVENSTSVNDDEIDPINDSPFLKLDEKLLLRFEPSEYDDLNLFKKKNLLIMGTDSGSLHIAIYGSLLLRVDIIKDHFRCSRILEINISKNFDRMYVLIKDFENEIFMIILQTDLFCENEKELKAISVKYHNIIRLARFLDRSMISLSESWNKILFEMDIKLSKYANKYSSERLASDFFNLLLFGMLSSEMHDFLTGDLTEKEFKKMGTTIESSYSKIQVILSKNLTDAIIQLIYILSELCGLSELVDFKEKFGLDYKIIRNAMKSAGSYFLKSKEVEQVIIQSMVNFKSFFRWLYVVMLRLLSESVPQEVVIMTTQDINYITEFLKNFLRNEQKNPQNDENRFNFERIAQYLENKPLTVPCDLVDNEWLSIIKDAELLSTDLIYTNDKSASLTQVYKRMCIDVDDVFNHVDEQLKKLIDINTQICFKYSTKYSTISLTDKNLVFYACLEHTANPNGIYLSYVTFVKDVDVKLFGLHVIFADSANGLEVVDLKFFDQNTLLILLTNRDQQVSYLCQYCYFADPNLYRNIGFNDSLSVDAYPQVFVDLQNESVQCLKITNFIGKALSASGSRKLCVVLAENSKTIKIFEMNPDDDDDDVDMSTSGLRDSNFIDDD